MRQYPRWYYDEFKQCGVDYTDIEEVNTYDLRMQNLRNIENESNRIRELLKIKKSDVVLEIGTGTGELALKISAHCKQVIAIDVSKMMINFARRKAESQNKTNIQFYNAGFLTYENHDELFDVIVTQLALHHLPDYWKMMALRRIYGMLKEEGKFYLHDVVFPSSIQNYDSYFDKIITDLEKSAGDKIAEETEIHIKEEFSTLDWVMEGLLTGVGFYIEYIKYDGFMASYICKK
ncbi:class I SAM-dependent methyltransferase [Methanosarcina sp. T3]|uniref:class I SAM-dependent methyltransferase n=1 Tax=Methanosarcina sp. T3 TaxID=3439062 RepID=UPI003F83DCD3